MMGNDTSFHNSSAEVGTVGTKGLLWDTSENYTDANVTDSIFKLLDINDNNITFSPNNDSNITHVPNDVMNVSAQSTAVLDNRESTFDSTLIVAIVCFGVGAIVLTLAFVRLAVWAHRYRRTKEHKKVRARQLEHQRHLDDYSVKTEIASQHSMLSIMTEDESEAERKKEKNNDESDFSDSISDKARDSKEIVIPKTEIEAIIGTVESRKNVRRSFYGGERSTLPANGTYAPDLGLGTPGNRRSFFMSTKSGTLQYN